MASAAWLLAAPTPSTLSQLSLQPRAPSTALALLAPAFLVTPMGRKASRSSLPGTRDPMTRFERAFEHVPAEPKQARRTTSHDSQLLIYRCGIIDTRRNLIKCKMSLSFRYIWTFAHPFPARLDRRGHWLIIVRLTAKSQQRIRLRSRPFSIRPRCCFEGRKKGQWLPNRCASVRGYVPPISEWSRKRGNTLGKKKLKHHADEILNLGIKAKVENKGQYEQYLEELKPLREELGVNLKEELFPEQK